MSSWDTSFSRSVDNTDGITSVYTSLSDQKSAILEEKQEDFVPYTPLDRGIFIIFQIYSVNIFLLYFLLFCLIFFFLEEDSMRLSSDSNVNNNINLINNNIVGNRSSSSSQVCSFFKT